MSAITTSQIETALRDFKDPESGREALPMGQLRDFAVQGNAASLTLALTTHSAAIRQETAERIADLLKSRIPQLTDVKINAAIHERPATRLGQVGLTAKSVIAVGSGKGGVGKSTIAAALALGLKRAGSKVGLMDADVYGPSIPHLLGLGDAPKPMISDGKIVPVLFQGMPVMSMGFLVPPGEAVVWRGPMLHGAITQFLRDTEWGPLDYLIIDMPPGTGDIALTLSQLLPLTGAVVVCTPQDVALLDAVKAIAMFRKVHIPMLGMVENMSYFICPGCGRQYDIFGSGGAKRRAAELDVPFLGEVPINIGIRMRGDAGDTAANFSDETTASFFRDISTRLVRQISKSHKAEPPLPSLSVL
jgi:ATP-binding protein involved in chromosome partitioning